MTETLTAEARRLQTNLDDENEGIALYHVLAAAEPDLQRRQVFEHLAVIEGRHADTWRQRLRDMGVQPKERGLSLKLRRRSGSAQRGPPGRSRRYRGRSVLDGGRGIRFDASAARAVRAPDRNRRARARGVPRRGGTRARRDLSGQRSTRGTSPLASREAYS